jgi:hypothetical protein
MIASAIGPASARSFGVEDAAMEIYSDGVAQLQPQCIFNGH